MESTHEYSTSLNNWHNGAALVQLKLAELRLDKPFFWRFNWQGLTWYMQRVTTWSDKDSLGQASILFLIIAGRVFRTQCRTTT